MIVLPSAKYFSSVPSVAEIARFKTNRSTATFGGLNSFYVFTTTGYAAVTWWDGVTTIYGSGNPNAQIFISKSVVAPYNTTAEKDFSVYSCDVTSKIIGYITNITFNSSSRSPITFIDHYSLSQLSIFFCDSGTGLTSYRHNGRINSLSLSSTGLTSLDLSNGQRLYSVNLPNNLPLTSITGVSSLQNLEIFNANGAGITSIDFSGLQRLYDIDLRSSYLTSIRAVGCSLVSDSYSTSSFFVGGAKLQNTGLNSTAINQFFTDLANGDGYINIGCATGAGSADSSIATAKGYTVLGNVPC
jgi:hypothetical protein